MKRTQNSSGVTGSVLLALVLAGGCASPDRLGVESLQDQASIEKNASEFWDVTNPPKFAGVEKPRVAIAEFSLEYVGQSEEREQRANLTQGVATALPEVLYASFVATLPEFNREVIPTETVTGTAAYGKLVGTSLASMNLSGPSKWGVLYPAPGLLVLDETQSGPGIAGLIKELGADSVIQVRLRVGLHEGRGVIEKGSTVKFATPLGTGLLTSKKALVSQNEVVDSHEAQVDASKIPIDSVRFREELQSLFRPYISMALVAARRAAEAAHPSK